MPSKKKKYSARFPPARIKKIMQTDEDVGKVAAAVPVLISRALERFIETLIVRTSETTQAKNAKTLTTTHVKQTIHAEKKFDFLKDLVAAVPDHQTEEDTDNLGAQGDTKKQKVPRQKKQKEGGRKKRKTKNSSESSENDVNGEEEEEKESTSSTDTEEETSEHNRTHAENQKNPTNCEHETKYPTPSFSGHMMHPRLNQANNILPPMHVSASPMPVLPGNAFPSPPGLGVQYPMKVNNVIPHQTQPLDLCSTNSMYPQSMYSGPAYSYPQGYSCGQPLTPLVTPNSHQDQQLSSPGCKNITQDGQGSRTFDQQTAMSAPNMNSQSQHSAKPAPQLPISLSSFSKLSTPQVCEDDDYDT